MIDVNQLSAELSGECSGSGEPTIAERVRRIISVHLYRDVVAEYAAHLEADTSRLSEQLSDARSEIERLRAVVEAAREVKKIWFYGRRDVEMQSALTKLADSLAFLDRTARAATTGGSKK
jgi:hypothetical protein